MRPLITPEEMRRADTATIRAGTPAEVLMERAGDAVARAVVGLSGGRYGCRVAVICGKGNNGGDGFAAARRLAREGLGVVCAVVGDPERIAGPAARHLERLARESGIVPRRFSPADLEGAHVVVDAILGTGSRGAPRGPVAKAIGAINDRPAPVVAVDIPSGVDGATGAVPGPAIRAAITVALGAEKIGTAVGRGGAHAGEVVVDDIGIAVPETAAAFAEPVDAAPHLIPRPIDAHKRSVGTVVLLAGSDDFPGAAVLAASGAARMGAGYVTLATTDVAARVVQTSLPEVVCVVASDGRVLGPDARARSDAALARAGAVAIGPGIGADAPQRALVEEILTTTAGPVVVDADALNALATGAGSLARRDQPTVITPHPGELARLLEVEKTAIQEDRAASARRAARLFGCVVVLKGWRTIVAEPRGRMIVVGAGGPELATAGTGDVLTGATAALLAAGVAPFEAAWSAALVHGAAGAAAVRARRGGVVAGDVAEALGVTVAMISGVAS